ncbi:MAG: hypothetical protein JRF25_10535 [Deltaproteobacteria bacterium]|nr:hypothetical protein [Deltaproteobacteria bacterium]
MNIAMIRIFDNVGYYETRFILMIFALAAALFFLAKKKDRNYLVMFISGAVWQSVMSLVVMNMTLRGQEYSLLLFGFQVPSVLIWLIQGVFEGGIHGLMGYWFLDVYINRGSDQKQGWMPYMSALIFVLVMSLAVGFLNQGQSITSVRPMFKPGPILAMFYVTFITLVIAGFKGGAIFRLLCVYFIGTLIYSLVNLEPLHPLGVRYIGYGIPGGEVQAMPPIRQIFIMLYSHLWEIAGSRLHYFVIPYVLGLLAFKQISTEKS